MAAPTSLTDLVRADCAAVAAQAEYVGIDHGRLPGYLAELRRTPPDPQYDLVHHYRAGAATDRPRAAAADTADTAAAADTADTAEDTAGYVLVLDAVNFGSGYFPALRKLPGASGYHTVATLLTRSFEQTPWRAKDLVELTVADVTGTFGQRDNPAAGGLMELFTAALHELGGWLLTEHGGGALRAVTAAGGSAEALAQQLFALPMWADVSDYRGRQVHLAKRAQLTAVDLALAFNGVGPGAFNDLHRLTMFADNLVPHVLRTDGLLRYRADLAEHIDAGRPIAAGAAAEVEIRAVAVHAVELLAAAWRDSDPAEDGQKPVSAADLDYLLWNRGQQPSYRAAPRHRTRTTNY